MAGPSSRYNKPFSMGSRGQPLVIDDEDEDIPQNPFSACTREVADIWRRVRLGAAFHDLTLDDIDDSLDEQAHREIEEAEAKLEQEFDVIDLTQDEEVERTAQRRRANVARRASFSASHKSVRARRIDGMRFRIGDCVELKQSIGDWAVHFIEVKSIWVSSTGEVVLRGLPYAKARHLEGRLECKQNEVCQILQLDVDDAHPDQADVEISAGQVLCRRSLHKTNAQYPKLRYGDDMSWLSSSKADIESLAPLTCRWKMRILYKDRRPWRYAAALVHLVEDDVDNPKFRVSDQVSRKDWLGIDEMRINSTNGQNLTFGDIFSGCGGVTRGAIMAGLEPTVSVDHWDIAHKSFKRNFPNVRTYNEDVFHYINRTSPRSCRRVDILHLSPPCQFFAPCHTRQGPNDDNNTAALFACTECVKKLRPRLVTLEQTFGLVDRHHAYFNSLVNGFTSLGYSIEWRVVPLIEYGLPQTRKRLIIIAACPGEELPPWPAPTHGPRGSGLKPFVTEIASFRQLRRNMNLHDVRVARQLTATPRRGDVPFSGTITCTGPTTGSHHYSGTREFTLRELACLQGFPLHHVFEGNKTAIKKQIGNAFAPCVVKVFLEHLRKCLERHDAAETSLPATPRRSPPPSRPASPASSATIGFSPSPRPSSLNEGSSSSSSSSLGKRKFKDVDDKSVKMESLMKRIQRMEVSQEPDGILLDKSPNGDSNEGQASQATSSASDSRDWTPFPTQGGQSTSFPRRLWKLPETRDSSADWRF